MQEIDQLYKDKGVRVLGVLTASAKPEDAKKLLAEGKGQYTNIIAEGSLAEYIKKYKYVPTTLYISKNGEHAKRFYYGGKTIDQFKTIIDNYLAEYKE